MNLGVVVEGPSDRATYPVLIRRIRNDIGTLQVRDCGGRFKLKEAFPYFLEEFQRNHAWGIKAAFVIRDSDCKPSQKIENDLSKTLDASGFMPNFSVNFFAAKCDLETWLLVDQDAINEVSRRRGKNKQVVPVQFEFESEKAKEVFRSQLSKASLRPVPDVYRDIATSLDLDRVASTCPSFQRFISKVRAC